ncbi:MAG: hypothetical protein ACLRXB_20435 [Escherichia coli]
MITNVHKSDHGRQLFRRSRNAVHHLKFKSAMGVATPEEWMWLESAGLRCFRRSVFKAKLNGIPSLRGREAFSAHYFA